MAPFKVSFTIVIAYTVFGLFGTVVHSSLCPDLDHQIPLPDKVTVGTVEFDEILFIDPTCFCVVSNGQCKFASAKCGRVIFDETVTLQDTIFWLFPKSYSHSIKYTLSMLRDFKHNYVELGFRSSIDNSWSTQRVRSYLQQSEKKPFEPYNLFGQGYPSIEFPVVSLSYDDFFWKVCRNRATIGYMCCYNYDRTLLLSLLELVGYPDAINSYNNGIIRKPVYSSSADYYFKKYYPDSVVKPRDLSSTFLPFYGVVRLERVEIPTDLILRLNVGYQCANSKFSESVPRQKVSLSKEITNFINTNLSETLIRDDILDGVKSLVNEFSLDIDKLVKLPAFSVVFLVSGVPFLLHDKLRFLKSEKEGYGYITSSLCISVLSGRSDDVILKAFKNFRMERNDLYLDTYDYVYVTRLCDRLFTVELSEYDLFHALIDYEGTCGFRLPSFKSYGIPISVSPDGNLTYYRLIKYGGHYRVTRSLSLKLNSKSTHLVTFHDAWYLPIFGLFLRSLKWLITTGWHFTMGLLDKVFSVFDEFGGCCFLLVIYSTLDLSVFLILLHQQWCWTYFIMSFLISFSLRGFKDTCCFGLASRISEVGFVYDLDL
ncbi:hypothetical protein [Pistachio virus Y]|uniref:Uncharacterized protein n=1 Tax=Pistachio virus Y TaxID=2794239 RepID=A0A7T0M850_9VIRU|nr:hypothetical protein [Pistachio virus Y]